MRVRCMERTPGRVTVEFGVCVMLVMKDIISTIISVW